MASVAHVKVGECLRLVLRRSHEITRLGKRFLIEILSHSGVNREGGSVGREHLLFSLTVAIALRAIDITDTDGSLVGLGILELTHAT